jgi:nitrite reductase (NADH) large subunit
VYKKLCVKDDQLVGAVMYGDTADGAWYFQLLKDKQNIAEIRDHLMFGQSHIGDAGHAGQSKAAAMPDTAEVCGCNGVCKGTIVKAIKEQGLFTSTTCASTPRLRPPAAPAPAWSSRSSPPPSAAPTSRPRPKTRRCAAAPSIRTVTCASAIREQHLLAIPDVDGLHGMGCAQRLCLLPPRAQLLPHLDLAA